MPTRGQFFLQAFLGVFLLAGMIFSLPVLAHVLEPRSEITVSNVRAVFTPMGGGAIYLDIENTGDLTDTFQSASVSIPGNVMLHGTKIDENGVARMFDIPSVSVAAGETVAFAPLAKHIMLSAVPVVPVPGSEFTVTLSFEHFGDLETEVQVVPLTQATMGSL